MFTEQLLQIYKILMENNSSVKQGIPFLPLAVESAVRADQPLAENLANAAPELVRFTQDQFSMRQYIARQCADVEKDHADLALKKIETQLGRMGELFLALKTWLLLNGKYVEAQAIGALNSTDDARVAQTELLKTQADVAKNSIHDLLQRLEFDTKLQESVAELDAGALFAACEHHLHVLQRQWMRFHASHLAKALKLQTRTLYAVAANCLVGLAEDALDNVLHFDEIPQGLEDLLMTLEHAKTNPFTGYWPQSIDFPII